MGIKIVHISRNKKLEKELQKKILTIVNDSKYNNVPMVFINACQIKESSKDVLIDISEGDYAFIFNHNIFIGKQKSKRSDRLRVDFVNGKLITKK